MRCSVFTPMSARETRTQNPGRMNAEAIEQAERRLHELRLDEWADLGLAASAIGLALAASVLHPPFVVPLLIGALASAVLTGRAFFRRLELSDRLLLDGDAYAIPEIRRRGEDMASMENRQALARAVRAKMTPAPGYSSSPRVVATEELRALASELDDDGLSLDPVCAARCHQLVNNYAESPLLNSLLPDEDIQVWIRRIHLGFEPKADSVEAQPGADDSTPSTSAASR
jgi:hypothetical protein